MGLCLSLAKSTTSDVSQVLSYQGRVTINGVNFNGTGRFHIEPVAGYPQIKRLAFRPRFLDRTYKVQFPINLTNGTGWADFGGGTTTDKGEKRAVTNTKATAPSWFYRV
jgi:hypothetical protein